MEFNQTKNGIARIETFGWLIDVLVDFGTRANTWIDPYMAGIEIFDWLDQPKITRLVLMHLVG